MPRAAISIVIGTRSEADYTFAIFESLFLRLAAIGTTKRLEYFFAKLVKELQFEESII